MINDNLLSVTGGDLITYLNGSEGTATSINQAWMDYLTREGYTTGTLNDRLYNKLRDDGFTGTLADMLTGFWSTPAINYVARLNGTDQYWVLTSPIRLAGNYRVEVELESIETAAGQKIFDSQGLNRRFDINFVNSAIDLRDYADFKVNNVSTNTINDINSFNLITAERDDNTPDRQERELYFIGCRYAISNFLSGVVKNLRVYDENNTLLHEIPLTNKAQGAYQVATTTPLGANLYTQEVIENPDDVGDQWSYLGGGRWMLVGDGSLSALQFLDGQDQPSIGYLQFEIESIAGGTLLCAAQALDETTFSTTGVKTYYYNNINELGQIQFKRRSGAVQAIIKNIKHYDAEGILVAEMVGYTPDVWEEA